MSIQPSPSVYPETIFIYGPPGSGKSSIGPKLAETLKLPFYDLDDVIRRRSGMTIPEIFSEEGETGFRERERAALVACIELGNQVLALGGGTFLDEETRQKTQLHGTVLCLSAERNILFQRLQNSSNVRPLLQSNGSFENDFNRLMDNRQAHYASFQLKLDTSSLSIMDAVWEAQILIGMFRIAGMGKAYDVRVKEDGLRQIGEMLHVRQIPGPIVVVTDEHVASYHLDPVLQSLEQSGYSAKVCIIKPGEGIKNIQTVVYLWEQFLELGVERQSTVIALGGGVVGDLVGFAAATYMRGIRWVAIPTTLLAMVDASLGGKTGADLPQGKNLIGAFHPPELVLADPSVLKTLPEREVRCGMAEVIKHGIIADPGLFELCNQNLANLSKVWYPIVRRAMAVKIKIIQEDPYEKNVRAVLNLGHTLGHALEKLTDYQLAHGEAVAIGISIATRYAENMGIAQAGLTREVVNTLQAVGLPTAFSGNVEYEQIVDIMKVDKKKRSGIQQFVLPVRIGEVKWGVPINDFHAMISLLNSEAR
jgi:3-dehydroquinate synthase